MRNASSLFPGSRKTSTVSAAVLGSMTEKAVRDVGDNGGACEEMQ